MNTQAQKIRYQIIYKNKGCLPNSGRTMFRSYKQAMKAINHALIHCESCTLCTIERHTTGYSLIDTKDFN